MQHMILNWILYSCLKKNKHQTVGCAVWHMGSWFLEAVTPALEVWDLNHWTARRNPGFLI